MEFDRPYNYRYAGENRLILSKEQIYSPPLASRVSDLIFVLNFFFLSDKSGEVWYAPNTYYLSIFWKADVSTKFSQVNHKAHDSALY